MHVDPRAGVLANRLYDATGLADYTTCFHVVTEDSVTGGHHKIWVLLGLRGSSSSSTTTTVATVAMIIGPVVVIVPWSGPTYCLRIIILVIVVVPLRSRPLHLKKARVFQKNAKEMKPTLLATVSNTKHCSNGEKQKKKKRKRMNEWSRDFWFCLCSSLELGLFKSLSLGPILQWFFYFLFLASIPVCFSGKRGKRFSKNLKKP